MLRRLADAQDALDAFHDGAIYPARTAKEIAARERSLNAELAAAKAAAYHVAWSRRPNEACQNGTTGCSVNHTAAGANAECATW